MLRRKTLENKRQNQGSASLQSAHRFFGFLYGTKPRLIFRGFLGLGYQTCPIGGPVGRFLRIAQRRRGALCCPNTLEERCHVCSRRPFGWCSAQSCRVFFSLKEFPCLLTAKLFPMEALLRGLREEGSSHTEAGVGPWTFPTQAHETFGNEGVF